MNDSDKYLRLSIEIHGAVQGVGFRPFVYRLATDLGLTGWVINDSRGVFIEVEGAQNDLRTFLDRVAAEKPAISIINSLDAAWLEPIGFTQFEIRHSDDQGGKSVLILPDIATCPDCLAEVLDPTDRRYQLPLHQLHELRPPLQHHSGAALRPAQHDHASFCHVSRLPG